MVVVPCSLHIDSLTHSLVSDGASRLSRMAAVMEGPGYSVELSPGLQEEYSSYLEILDDQVLSSLSSSLSVFISHHIYTHREYPGLWPAQPRAC